MIDVLEDTDGLPASAPPASSWAWWRPDGIELVADELITNVPMRTEGSAIVTLRASAGSEQRLRVEVEESSSVLPRRREAEVSGRGLLLVDRLTDVWGVEARGGGKRVCCEFVLPGAR